MKLILVLLMGWTSLALAMSDQYTFGTQEQRDRFVKLTDQIRCVVCQNQNLSESHASLAQDMRNKIALSISQGQTDKQIINFLVKHYGEFILYRPTLSQKTFLLWTGPFIVLFFGILILFFQMFKRKS